MSSDGESGRRFRATAVSAALRAELQATQELGLIGPAPIDHHLQQAVGYATAVGMMPHAAADLGSGGGIPALVLAEAWPECRFTLIDSRERAIARLEIIVARLGWSDRMTMHLGSAEDVGRDSTRRGSFDVVTARGFGPPPMTAECGAPLLRPGGRLVVSEPPVAAPRWPPAGLARLGLRDVETESALYKVMESVEPCPAGYPRRQGRPRRKPLW